ncbi:MAG: metal ABC transporter ATP-binding protein [Clostridiales bacterium]|nr:metal ABC transporter ATP-binding protein [Clostridiales bacterium]
MSTDNYSIVVEHLSVKYDNNIALYDINMKIVKGEYIALIGPNGGGKTTLIKSILGLIKQSEGEVKINGRASYVPQLNTVDKDFPATVKDMVLSGTFKGKIKPFFKYSEEDHMVTDSTMKSIGISHLSDKRISELSGGEFQKMLIARCIASGADILFLDEPYSNVDSEARISIYNILKELKGKYTIVMSTHDIMAVSEYADSIACINEKLVYHGKPEINQRIVDEMYGCNVDILAHGVAHRVLRTHEKEGDAND